jgi:hypothetical protein
MMEDGLNAHLNFGVRITMSKYITHEKDRRALYDIFATWRETLLAESMETLAL